MGRVEKQMRTVAKELNAYLKARASYEAVAYQLKPKFLREQLYQGVREFFGVMVSLETGLVYDTQEPRPNFFKDWMESKPTLN